MILAFPYLFNASSVKHAICYYFSSNFPFFFFRIQNLSLRHCGITNQGAVMIGRCLGSSKRGNKQLLSLNLSNNKIGDEGVLEIAQVEKTFYLYHVVFYDMFLYLNFKIWELKFMPNNKTIIVEKTFFDVIWCAIHNLACLHVLWRFMIFCVIL